MVVVTTKDRTVGEGGASSRESNLLGILYDHLLAETYRYQPKDGPYLWPLLSGQDRKVAYQRSPYYEIRNVFDKQGLRGAFFGILLSIVLCRYNAGFDSELKKRFGRGV